MGNKDEFLTTSEYSKLTGMSASTVAKHIRRKKIRGEKRAGKWMIPRSELPAEASAPNDPLPSQPQNVTKKQTASSYSVAEFSERTYLTETGVVTFLTKGKLQGFRDDNGNWRVDAASLRLSHIRHLVRD